MKKMETYSVLLQCMIKCKLLTSSIEVVKIQSSLIINWYSFILLDYNTMLLNFIQRVNQSLTGYRLKITSTIGMMTLINFSTWQMFLFKKIHWLNQMKYEFFFPLFFYSFLILFTWNPCHISLCFENKF